MVILTPSQEKKLMVQLKNPLHINFVSHLLKITPEDAKYLLKDMEKNGIVIEYNRQIGKDYYVIKNQ
jgi:hypothetical protein